jgi:hypothetical protein
VVICFLGLTKEPLLEVAGQAKVIVKIGTGYCQETLTKKVSMIYLFGQETFKKLLN